VAPIAPDLPYRPGSRAILIGVSDYDDDAFLPIPAVRNSLVGMRQVLTDPQLCGWPDDRVTVLLNPRNAGTAAAELHRLLRAVPPSGVALVYYVGHGRLTVEGGLCLTVTDTADDVPESTSIGYSWVAQSLGRGVCAARVKITILDCCYSGHATQAMAAAGDGLADITHIDGVYTLTATTRNRTAHVPPLAEQQTSPTSFTGQLLDLIHAGIPEGPAYLSFNDLYPHLQHRLARRALPRPDQGGRGTADRHPFTRNTAWATAQPPPPPSPRPRQPVPPKPDRQGEARQREEADQARLRAVQQEQEAQRQRAAEQRRETRRRAATVAGSLAVVAVAGVVAATVLPGIIAPPTSGPDAGYVITSRLVTSAQSRSPIASDGTHLWAIDGSSVEELDASNGSVIRTLSGSKYHFGTPTGIAANGTHVWVTNGIALTEVNATTGDPINILQGSQWAAMQPTGIADDGTHLWITSPAGNWVDPALNQDGPSLNYGTGSVVELNASNGSVIRTLSGIRYQFNDPVGITSDGTHVWVTNEDDGRWVVELNASNGSVIRTLPDLSAPGTTLMVHPFPGGIATDGTRVWVADYANSLVTELNAGNGSFIRTLSGGGSYPWDFPNAIAVAGTHVWVTSKTGLAELTLEKSP
jgi:hypothetical protein